MYRCTSVGEWPPSLKETLYVHVQGLFRLERKAPLPQARGNPQHKLHI